MYHHHVLVVSFVCNYTGWDMLILGLPVDALTAIRDFVGNDGVVLLPVPAQCMRYGAGIRLTSTHYIKLPRHSSTAGVMYNPLLEHPGSSYRLIAR